MGVWIRSQDGKSLREYFGVYTKSYSKGRDGIWGESTVTYDEDGCAGTDYFLGSYQTEERAIEVLDEILSFINDYSFAEATGEGCIKVFKMPKE